MINVTLTRAIEAASKRHGSLRAAARVLQVDAAYLLRLSTGEKENPSDALLRKLGLRRIVEYVPIDRGAAGEAE